MDDEEVDDFLGSMPEGTVCGDCGEEIRSLGVAFRDDLRNEEEEEIPRYCTSCFSQRVPESAGFINAFEEIWDWIQEAKSRYMTLDEWEELYGDGDEDV